MLLNQLDASNSAERMTTLMRDCPRLHKLGQLLARDPRLDPGFREELRELVVLPSSGQRLNRAALLKPSDSRD